MKICSVVIDIMPQ